MNFVELVDDLRKKAGASGHRITTIQEGLRPEAERLTDAIRDAWVDIQIMHDEWSFREEVAVHVTEVNSNVLNSGEYQSSQIAVWKIDSIRIAEPGEGLTESLPVCPVPWETFKRQQGLKLEDRDKPIECSVRPQDNALMLYPAADAAYPVFYEYVRNPQILKHDDDVPIISEHLHRLIVYEAMLTYAFYEVATEVLEEAKRHRQRLLHEMNKRFLPTVRLGTL